MPPRRSVVLFSRDSSLKYVLGGPNTTVQARRTPQSVPPHDSMLLSIYFWCECRTPHGIPHHLSHMNSVPGATIPLALAAVAVAVTAPMTLASTRFPHPHPNVGPVPGAAGPSIQAYTAAASTVTGPPASEFPPVVVRD